MGGLWSKFMEPEREEGFKVFQFYIPHSSDFDQVVEMFKFNGIKVDDLGSTTRDGRVVNIWIRSGDLDNMTLDEKVGGFM